MSGKRPEKKKWMINEADFRTHIRDQDGLCLSCGSWTSGGVEPDASRYACEQCDEKAVYGAEQAMLIGRLDVVDDSTEIPEALTTKA